jgi:hypothetical protein
MTMALPLWRASRKVGLLLGLAVLGGGLLRPAALRAEESLPERRMQVEGMTPEQKDELRRREERFAALDPAEQERLRRLQREIDQDPQAEQLRRVMHNYHKWLMSLPDFQREKLLEMEPELRLKQIKALLDEQSQREAGKLNPQDLAGVTLWLDEFARRHGLELVPERQRAAAALRFKQLPDAERDREFWRLVWWRMQWSGGPKIPLVGPGDLVQLRNALTPETRARLESKSFNEQWTLVSAWLVQIFRQRFKAALNDDELARYFEQNLTDVERDRLLRLPSDEMQRQLRREYAIAMKPLDWLGGHGGQKQKGKGDKTHKPKRNAPLPQPAPGSDAGKSGQSAVGSRQ